MYYFTSAIHCVTGGLASEFALQVTVVLLRIRNCSILGRCFCDLVLIASMPLNHHHDTKILEILHCAVFRYVSSAILSSMLHESKPSHAWCIRSSTVCTVCFESYCSGRSKYQHSGFSVFVKPKKLPREYCKYLCA